MHSEGRSLCDFLSGADVFVDRDWWRTNYHKLDLSSKAPDHFVVRDDFFIDKNNLFLNISCQIHLSSDLVQFDIDICKVFSLHLVSLIQLKHNRQALLLQNFDGVYRCKKHG